MVGLGVCYALPKWDNFAVVSCLIWVTLVMTAFVCLCALHTIAVDAINIEKVLIWSLLYTCATRTAYAHGLFGGILLFMY